MDDTLGFSEQEKKPEEWHLGGEESISSVASKVGPQSYDLQIMSKKEHLIDRPMIKASKWEKLAYYRSYATSQSKLQFMCMQQDDFSTYLWNYLINVFCKSLPTTYVYSFLSSYAPESHFFISKMFPFAYGSTLFFIMTALFEIIMATQNTTLYLDYFVMGLLYKSPWNRCPRYNYTYNSESVTCFEDLEFAKQFVNTTVNFTSWLYTSPTAGDFQLAQILYHLFRDIKFWDCDNICCLYFIFLWIGATVAYKIFFKSFLWKTLNAVHNSLNLILFATFIHLTLVYYEKGFKKYPIHITEVFELMQESDLDLLLESMTTPPIIHILSSRSTDENKPVQDSAVIITSNAVYYMFRGFVSYLLKLYCDNVMNTSLQEGYFSAQSLFYLWPIYFTQFYLGDIFGILFFFLNFLHEYLVLVITLQCLIEAISSEWRWLRPCIVVIFLSILGVVPFFFLSVDFFENMYIVCTSLATLMEVLIIFFVYPLGRLVDDMTFFHGVRPTKLRLVTFWIVPVFYVLKFYVMMTGFVKILKFTTLPEEYPNYKTFVWCLATPLLIGVLFAIIYYVFIMKMGWLQLFKPLPNWGPRDFLIRQLRKRYDSRFYIGSQSSRDLSRFLIDKSEFNAYKLDLRYDTLSRGSSQRVNLNKEDEKKSI